MENPLLRIRTLAIVYIVVGVAPFIPVGFTDAVISVRIAVGVVVLAEIRRQILRFFLRLLRFLLRCNVIAKITQSLAHLLQRVSCRHPRN